MTKAMPDSVFRSTSSLVLSVVSVTKANIQCAPYPIKNCSPREEKVNEEETEIETKG